MMLKLSIYCVSCWQLAEVAKLCKLVDQEKSPAIVSYKCCVKWLANVYFGKKGGLISMPITINGEEFLTIEESCEYLGRISRETLRRRTKEAGIERYTRGITRTVYYRKTDLDRLLELRPVKD